VPHAACSTLLVANMRSLPDVAGIPRARGLSSTYRALPAFASLLLLYHHANLTHPSPFHAFAGCTRRIHCCAPSPLRMTHHLRKGCWFTCLDVTRLPGSYQLPHDQFYRVPTTTPSWYYLLRACRRRPGGLAPAHSSCKTHSTPGSERTPDTAPPENTTGLPTFIMSRPRIARLPHAAATSAPHTYRCATFAFMPQRYFFPFVRFTLPHSAQPKKRAWHSFGCIPL